jgi:hypothetical protein
MHPLNISKAHQPPLEQLTGCRYAVLISLAGQVRERLAVQRRGRPFKHSVLVMTVLALMKLRCNLSVRSMEALTAVDAVTVARCVNRVVAVFSQLPLAAKVRGPRLIVDSTSVRVATTSADSYSGHKHQRCAKTQVLVREDGQVVDVSPAYAGAVHDKTIWNKEAGRLKPLFDQLVLADKAYAGASGEKEHLLRPIKRGETAYMEDKEKAKEFNRGLSKVRVKVEHAFARLKTWRALAGIFPYRWQRLGGVVRALAVVHNLNREMGGVQR